MGDIANDVKCGRDGCGHLASSHADTDEGANNGACSMKGCECSSMDGGSSSDDGDGDAAADAVSFSEDRAEREAQLRLVETLSASPTLSGSPGIEALKKMSAAYCFRTGCSHVTAEHLDLRDVDGMGKCTVNGCQCRAFMPQGSPGEPALPEPAVVADAAPEELADGAPGEPGGGPEEEVVEASGIPFRALLVQEGVETSDGRFIEPNATKWRTPPLSLGYQDKTEHGGFADTAAINIGRIDAIVREPGTAGDGTFDIWGTGVIDDEDPEALKAAHKIREKYLKGVSVDLAIFGAEVEITAVDEDGWPIGERFIVTDCEIGMATVTSFPAFGECQIELTGEEPSDAETLLGLELPEVGDRIPVIADAGPSFTFHFVDKTLEEREAMTVLASGGPMTPPRDWFAQPSFSETDLIEIPPALCGGRRNVRACPLTITDDGRVYGHLASWHVNHTAMSGRSLRAPRTAGYDLFNTRGVVRVDDGTDLPVGTITLDGGHADLRLDWKAAMAHYDDTRSAVIDCRVGADEHGVWLAGALRPDVDELSLRRLRAASISGDWRPFGNRHELVAACSVNTPGFPTLRAAVAASAASGNELVALVAAGALPTRPEPTADRLLAQATAELAHARREREADRLLRTIG